MFSSLAKYTGRSEFDSETVQAFIMHNFALLQDTAYSFFQNQALFYVNFQYGIYIKGQFSSWNPKS